MKTTGEIIINNDVRKLGVISSVKEVRTAFKANNALVLTLLSKGIYRGYSMNYIESSRAGKVSFCQVSKVGIKYITCEMIYYSHDSKTFEVNKNWDTKISLEDYNIIIGFHPELRTNYNNYKKAEETHNTNKENARRDIQSLLRKRESELMAEWDAKNPTPQNPILRVHYPRED
jgi:hypothetical protein